MSNNPSNRAADWFTPCAFWNFSRAVGVRHFPQVVLGVQTFVARDFGFFAFPLAHFQKECFWHGEIPFWDPYQQLRHSLSRAMEHHAALSAGR